MYDVVGGEGVSTVMTAAGGFRNSARAFRAVPDMCTESALGK